MISETKRRLRRAKDSERRAGRWFIEHDGPDPRFRPGAGLVTSTGRVGHVTGLQFDTLSRSYAGENKNIKVWAGLWEFWKKNVNKAREQGKEPCIRIEPTNDDAKGVPIMHIITEERHAELLRYEREAVEREQAQVARRPTVRAYSKEQQIGRKAKQRK